MQSKQARKQRKALYNAPTHVKRRMTSSHLSDQLMKEFQKRSTRVIAGDTVKVLRGDENVRGLEGKVSSVDTNTGRVIVEGVTMAKADGTQVARPIHSSNLVITKLDLNDPWRKRKLQGAKEGSA
jgi:large subunit ribosomal protein L24